MTTRDNSYKYYIYSLIFVIFFSYVFAVGKFFFFKTDEQYFKPISYQIYTSYNEVFSQSSEIINLSSEMKEIFDRENFNLEKLVNGNFESLIIFSSLPEDFFELDLNNDKQELFIKVVTSILYVENKKVLNLRKQILEWWTENDGEIIDKIYWPEWLKNVSEDYMHNDKNIGNLLIKVDMVPTSMAVAQSIIESGWGNSRFTKEGNAIFGQYTYDQRAGMVPASRTDSDKHLIRKFSNLSESVESYIKNINTHSAYEKFREHRKSLRMNGEKLIGHNLVENLSNYSEKKNLYINDVKKIIEDYEFEKFDNILFN